MTLSLIHIAEESLSSDPRFRKLARAAIRESKRNSNPTTTDQCLEHFYALRSYADARLFELADEHGVEYDCGGETVDHVISSASDHYDWQ